MGLNASKVKGNAVSNFPPQPDMEPGNYPIRLVQVIDLGLQPQRPYKGEDKAPAHEVMLTYEFLDCFMVDEDGNDIEDKPRWVSETIPLNNLKADRAKSTQRIKALDPNLDLEGDLTRMVNSPANATVVINESKGKKYTNIASLSPMRPRDAAKAPELKNPTKVFDLSNPDMEVFNKLPDWIKEKIQGNLEYAGSPLQKLLGGEEAPKQEKANNDLPDEEQENDVPW